MKITTEELLKATEDLLEEIKEISDIDVMSEGSAEKVGEFLVQKMNKIEKPIKNIFKKDIKSAVIDIKLAIEELDAFYQVANELYKGDDPIERHSYQQLVRELHTKATDYLKEATLLELDHEKVAEEAIPFTQSNQVEAVLASSKEQYSRHNKPLISTGSNPSFEFLTKDELITRKDYLKELAEKPFIKAHATEKSKRGFFTAKGDTTTRKTILDAVKEIDKDLDYYWKAGPKAQKSKGMQK